MANEFSKATGFAATRLFFEQLSSNVNPTIDDRINNNIASTHFPTSELIPKRNNEFRSKINNSKIPIHSPLIKSINVDIDDNTKSSKTQSSLSLTVEKTTSNKLLNKISKSSIPKIDNQYISSLKEIENSSSKKLFEITSFNSIPEILNKQYELPATPPMRPSRVSSPELNNTKTSPVAISKLPIPTNLKNTQENDKVLKLYISFIYKRNK